jgi:hypothetical protein
VEDIAIVKYQIVIQWPASTINEYDEMIEVEDVLIDRLSELHQVDGHDFGEGKMNIFLHTNNFKNAFAEVKAILEENGHWDGVRVAYREINKNKYIVLWPIGLKDFSVT